MQTGHVDRYDCHCILGWAADTDHPDMRLELRIMVNGTEHGRIVADQPRDGLRQRGIYGDGAHAFEYRFDPPLSPLRGYDVVVRFLETPIDVPNGRFRIEPERAQDFTLRPVLVSATGRSGTTLLMRRLGNAPEIVIADSYPFEMKLLTYYAHALEVLTTASSVKDQTSLADLTFNLHQLALNPFHHPELERLYPERAMLYQFFGRRTAARISMAFRDIIDEFYHDMRAFAQKFTARFFAEKCDVFTPARNFARLVYQGVKEILLVRDPRDIHCSRRAFWHDSPENSLQNLLTVQAALLPIRRADAGAILVVRYEDLVQQPADTMSRIAAYLELGHSLKPDPDGERAIFSGHGTSADPAASIGRWKHELSAEDRVSLSRGLKPFLQEFGYDPDPA
ncbi:MAG TPA: sulfotransferase [Acetobacteraceae bacterium]|nr:sulfotransferase [Acetobacteraceae bacterium]